MSLTRVSRSFIAHMAVYCAVIPVPWLPSPARAEEGRDIELPDSAPVVTAAARPQPVTKAKPLTGAYRWAVASRCLAAAVGGFALASTVSIVLAWLIVYLGWAPRASATATATIASFALWCGIVMWTFHTASLSRVWLQLVLPSLAPAALAWWLERLM